jgi:hypothetical protein
VRRKGVVGRSEEEKGKRKKEKERRGKKKMKSKDRIVVNKNKSKKKTKRNPYSTHHHPPPHITSSPYQLTEIHYNHVHSAHAQVGVE